MNLTSARCSSKQTEAINPTELYAIVRKIADAASGVFLWVELVVEQLAGRLVNGDRAEELEQRLHNTPTELVGSEGLYMRMLQDIAPRDREQGQHFFQAIRNVRHQISPFILSFSEDSREQVLKTPVRIIPDEEDLRKRLLQIQLRLKSHCAGLLELQQRSFTSFDVPEEVRPRIATSPFSNQLKYENPLLIHETAVINYYHQTVKEFLQSRMASGILTGSINFDYTSLLQAWVQRIKCMGYYPDDWDGNMELWAHLKDVLFYAEKAGCNRQGWYRIT